MLDSAQLSALANSRPEGYFGNTPVYRGVSTAGQVGGAGMAPPAGMTAGPSINYGALFSGITGAISTGAQQYAAADALKVPLMTVPDLEVAPRPPLQTLNPVIPSFARPPLAYLRPVAA